MTFFCEIPPSFLSGDTVLIQTPLRSCIESCTAQFEGAGGHQLVTKDLLKTDGMIWQSKLDHLKKLSFLTITVTDSQGETFFFFPDLWFQVYLSIALWQGCSVNFLIRIKNTRERGGTFSSVGCVYSIGSPILIWKFSSKPWEDAKILHEFSNFRTPVWIQKARVTEVPDTDYNEFTWVQHWLSRVELSTHRMCEDIILVSPSMGKGLILSFTV